ncbi:hypothetical protein GCK72_001670 [Caenorhabditis remanei]|uniref:C-type lectin domain-containing protein n=1 Tax=Caenorhabditis remanei TaxID=31234 RepID=A0A6A5HUE0_CAERE|nr:hypothetical protein GCK72_001670 [Caenorhabditis remanei]KAF1769853.1 hypothetical protein GCK72_001670 [Caenorhabditis remanei]
MLKMLLTLSLVLLFAVPTSAQLGNGTCDEGWKWFHRTGGGWCMKLFTGSYSWFHAAGLCQTQGARLSGIGGDTGVNPQQRIEQQWIKDALLNLTSHITDVQPNVWIGARRKPECMYKQLNVAALCIPVLAFEWTDGKTIGVNGFQWAPGEPNNVGGIEDCGALRTDMNKSNDFE